MDGTTMKIPADFEDLVEEFESRGVRYLIIGGYAVGVHAQPRATKDMDFLLDASPENLRRAADAVHAFGVPPHIPGQISAMKWDDVIWFGVSPLRVDLLVSAPELPFEECHARRASLPLGRTTAQVVHLDDLIRNKRAVGRPQDLADVAALLKFKAARTLHEK